MATESRDEPLVAWELDGEGGGRPVHWSAIGRPRAEGVTLWVHLNRRSQSALRWLHEGAGLDPLVVEALTAEETRPRVFDQGRGTCAILRGVNLNPGAAIEDMVSIRVWAEPGLVISVYLRRLFAIEDIQEALGKGNGPSDAWTFCVALAERLIERMLAPIQTLAETVDDAEEQVLEGGGAGAGAELAAVRSSAVRLRRFLVPQREALVRLAGDGTVPLPAALRPRVREAADAQLRHVEAIEELRERAALLQDELARRASRRIERTIYVLTVAAAVFLPITFVTGLLGVNLAGIPFAEWQWSFAALCAGLAIFVALEVLFLRRMAPRDRGSSGGG